MIRVTPNVISRQYESSSLGQRAPDGLRRAPPSLTNLVEIDDLLRGDQNRLIESLPVAPNVERRKPVHCALRRSQELYAQRANRTLAPLANELVADRQRPRGKFQGVRTCLVDKMSAGLASEPKPIQPCSRSR